MKTILAIALAAMIGPVFGEEQDPAGNLAKHQEGAAKVGDAQDSLAADVQQLAIEQTVSEVIELLNEVETIMDETTDRLFTPDTGGETIAAQTEIIEKIHDAAKEKQKQQGGGGEAGGAMLDMMERMMGKEPGQKPGENGAQPGQEGGTGMTGESDAANEATGPAGEQKVEPRKVPKAAGVAGRAFPEEFRQALDAYNRGAEEKAK
jgi:hypothetical protein